MDIREGLTFDDVLLMLEGVEGRASYKGREENILYQLVGGLRAAMSYTESNCIAE